MGKIMNDMKEHAKMQNKITKARHEVCKVTPADAKEMFKEQYELAHLSPLEKQKIKLAELQSQKKR